MWKPINIKQVLCSLINHCLEATQGPTAKTPVDDCLGLDAFLSRRAGNKHGRQHAGGIELIIFPAGPKICSSQHASQPHA